MPNIQHDIFDAIEILSKAVEKGERISSEEIDFINNAEEVIGISINQIEFIRTTLISQQEES